MSSSFDSCPMDASGIRDSGCIYASLQFFSDPDACSLAVLLPFLKPAEFRFLWVGIASMPFAKSAPGGITFLTNVSDELLENN